MQYIPAVSHISNIDLAVTVVTE